MIVLEALAAGDGHQHHEPAHRRRSRRPRPRAAAAPRRAPARCRRGRRSRPGSSWRGSGPRRPARALSATASTRACDVAGRERPQRRVHRRELRHAEQRQQREIDAPSAGARSGGAAAAARSSAASSAASRSCASAASRSRCAAACVSACRSDVWRAQRDIDVGQSQAAGLLDQLAAGQLVDRVRVVAALAGVPPARVPHSIAPARAARARGGGRAVDSGGVGRRARASPRRRASSSRVTPPRFPSAPTLGARAQQAPQDGDAPCHACWARR